MRYIFVEKLYFLVDFLEINDIMLVRGKSHCIYYGYLHNIKRDVSNFGLLDASQSVATLKHLFNE